MEKNLRVAELSVRGDWKWSLTMSYSVLAWLDLLDDGRDLGHRDRFDTLEEAKEYTENLVRVLIIGGHHERN